VASPESHILMVERLKAGDQEAVNNLWNEYFPRLVKLARSKMRVTGRRVDDEEDVALSALDSFCRAVARGRFSQLEGRDNLWASLARIAACKVADRVERNKAQKRGGGRVRGDSILVGQASAGSAAGFDRLEGRDQPPDVAALLAEEVERRLQRLEDVADPDLRRVAELRMAGLTRNEVARALKCSVPTVDRRLSLIRALLSED
jgi:DNA-directed RNA polymerase specialized sigma24 family protein